MNQLAAQSRRDCNEWSVKASVVFSGEGFGRCTVNPPLTAASGAARRAHVTGQAVAPLAGEEFAGMLLMGKTVS